MDTYVLSVYKHWTRIVDTAPKRDPESVAEFIAWYRQERERYEPLVLASWDEFPLFLRMPVERTDRDEPVIGPVLDNSIRIGYLAMSMEWGPDLPTT